MAEGTFSVTAVAFNATTHETHFFEPEVVGFHIFDSVDGDSARGDFGGIMIGIVRPMLDWQTKFTAKN